jgi:O-antigen/teichoic acid export membrane protein
MRSDQEDAGDGRRETELERADRNLTELQQELRVLTTGVQIMFAFLLTVPFTQRFSQVTQGERDLYLVVLLSAAAAAAFFIAPSAMHRLLFRHGDKPHLVTVSNRLAIAGIACLTLAMTGILTLVSGFLFGWIAGGIVAGLAALFFTGLWFALGIRRRMTIRPDGPGDQPR